ncbi:gustatory receptor 68a-like [Venturia canescens]|uniref:gustatory receptor 68a-like n=1 Tax=Venturia canescens TaxID=32260 RepID=UPI001C9C5630|nr:gustatory receptor 68a-like [Venturia canescens]
MKVDDTLYKLGASFDFRQCFLVGITNFSFIFLLLLGHIVFRVLLLLYVMPLEQAVFGTMLLRYPDTVSTFVGTTFWALVWYAGHKFYAVNKLLEEPYKHIYRRFESDDFGTFLQKKFHVTSFNMALCRHFLNGSDRKSFIQIIKHVHLEITLVTKDLNDIYGQSMLMHLGIDFVLFTSCFYMLYGLSTQAHTETRLFIIAMMALSWIVPFLLRVLLIIDVCESVTNEAKRTGQRIYHFTHSEEDSEFSDEIKEFGLQLYNCPVHFSPVGFFTLGYEFMGSFLGTVLTYLIILIQMDKGSRLQLR